MAQLNGVISAGNLTFTGTGRIFNGNTGVSSFLIPGGLDLALVGSNTVLGKGASGNIAALNTLPAVSGVNLTALNATQLTSGTIPDARYGLTLPAVSGVNLTALNATQLTSGTIPGARLPNPLPAVSGTNLTDIACGALVGTIADSNFPSVLPSTVGIDCSVNLTTGIIPNARFGTLPAVSGVNLTALNATSLSVGTIPDARFPSVLPSTVGIDCSVNLTAGTIPDARFPAVLPAISGAALTNIGISIITGLATGVAVFLASPSSVNFRTMMLDETGTGALLFAGGALGTPASGTLANCTGLPVGTGISGFGTGVAAFLADPTSAKFRTMITDESGTGALLFAGGALGTPLSGLLTNCVIPNLLGHITSVGNTTSLGSFTLAQLSTAVSDAVIARTDAGQTFVGNQNFTGDVAMSGDMTVDGANHEIVASVALQINTDAMTIICASAMNFSIGNWSAVASVAFNVVSPAFNFATNGAASLSFNESSNIVSVNGSGFTFNGIEVVDVESAQTLTNKAIIPSQNSQSGNYTLAITDADKDIFRPFGSGTGNVLTIPANSAVPFAVGTRVRFINRSPGNSVSIAINTDSLLRSPDGTTGTRTLAPYGIATAVKITTTEWMISGTGLT